MKPIPLPERPSAPAPPKVDEEKANQIRDHFDSVILAVEGLGRTDANQSDTADKIVIQGLRVDKFLEQKKKWSDSGLSLGQRVSSLLGYGPGLLGKMDATLEYAKDGSVKSLDYKVGVHGTIAHVEGSLKTNIDDGTKKVDYEFMEQNAQRYSATYEAGEAKYSTLSDVRSPSIRPKTEKLNAKEAKIDWAKRCLKKSLDGAVVLTKATALAAGCFAALGLTAAALTSGSGLAVCLLPIPVLGLGMALDGCQ